MIETIRLRNFKSIQRDDIEFKPLTIFTGPNSSGKSNILQAIAITSQISKQASRLALDLPDHLERSDAEFYRYPRPSIEHLVYKGELNREIMIEIHFLSRISKQIIGYSVKYTSDPRSSEQVIFINRRKVFHTIYKERPQPVNKIEYPLYWKGKSTKNSEKSLLRAESFIPPEDDRAGMKDYERKRDSRQRRRVSILINELAKGLDNVYPISAPRGIVPIEIGVGPDPKWVGKNGENLIHILSRIYGQSKYRAIQKGISDWSERFGIGNIAAGLRRGKWLGADFQDPRLNTILDITSSSYGSRQLLTMITQILYCNPNSTLLIEEPEISLHPQSQVLVQELFAEAISKGKQIICVTHSPFFILALSKVIRQQKLPKDEVAVYHVEKGSEGTKTRLLELNNRGFVEGWIPSYIDIEKELFSEWVESLE